MARLGGSRLTDINWRVGGDIDRIARASPGRRAGGADLLRPGRVSRPLDTRGIAEAGQLGCADHGTLLRLAIAGVHGSLQLVA